MVKFNFGRFVFEITLKNSALLIEQMNILKVQFKTSQLYNSLFCFVTFKEFCMLQKTTIT